MIRSFGSPESFRLAYVIASTGFVAIRMMPAGLCAAIRGMISPKMAALTLGADA
jgi:hypothetical protein